ncbi:MAG: hypothetical protein RH917_05110 [Lacipirellulaceae bacterium]
MAVPNVVAATESYIPESDEVVLEILPSTLFAQDDELTKNRQKLANDPKNLDLATTIAARYIQLGKQEGDPRLFGYARAALQPWWEESAPPSSVRKLRAELFEVDHDYDAALADLRRVVKKKPRDVQAWIELANILRVQGNYAEMNKARGSLSEFASPIEVMYVNVPYLAATGRGKVGYEQLEKQLPSAKAQFPETVPWILTWQAEIARTLGRDEEAEAHYREGLELNSGPSYLLRSYADFLLDRDRPEEALELVQDHTADTGCLLRAAIAAKNAGMNKRAEQWQQQLADRFEEIRLRGSEPHGRFESRWAFELKDDPKLALELALANWQKQREARDTRNVLEAAIAAKKPDAAQPVVDFLKEHGTQDVQFDPLLEQLGGE